MGCPWEKEILSLEYKTEDDKEIICHEEKLRDSAGRRVKSSKTLDNKTM